MKAYSSDRKIFNLQLRSVSPCDEKSPSIDSTPTFNNRLISFDSDREVEKGTPVKSESSRASVSNGKMLCMKCERLEEEIIELQGKLSEAERNSKSVKLELERVMDLHKNSRIYAVEQKDFRLEQELKQVYMEKRQLTDENRLLKENLAKKEKELRYSYLSLQNSIKSVQKYTKTPSTKIDSKNVCSFEKPEKLKYYKNNLPLLEITENEDSLYISKNVNGTDETEAIVQEKITKKNLKIQEKFIYINSNFNRLSNEFSNMLIMLESVIQIFFRKGAKEFEENADISKTVSDLLFNLNSKLENIKLIFLEIQDLKDPLKDYFHSPKDRKNEPNDKILSRYVHQNKGSEKRFGSEFNLIDHADKETETESEKIGFLEIAETKSAFTDQVNRELSSVWEICKEIKDEKDLLKLEISNNLNSFNRKISQIFNEILIKITKESGNTAEDKLDTRKEIEENSEKKNSSLIKKISKLKMKVKELKENKKNLSNYLFKLSTEKSQKFESASCDNGLDLKLKLKNKSYKKRVKKYKEKYNSLKEEYNALCSSFEGKELAEIQSEFLGRDSLNSGCSEKTESLEIRLNEERKKNKSLAISLNLMKCNFNDFEKSLKENLEKIADLIEKNSRLGVMIEDLKAENKALKEKFEEINIEKKENNEITKKELEKFRRDFITEFDKGNLSIKAKAFDLENSRKKLGLTGNFRDLNREGISLEVSSGKALGKCSALKQGFANFRST